MICTAMLVLASLFTAPPPEEKLAGLTFATVSRTKEEAHPPKWRRTDVMLSVLLAVCVGLVWIYFS